MKYIWENMNDEDKMAAVAEEINLATHMGTTKDDFIEIMKFLNSQLELYKRTLKVFCIELACDDSCPNNQEGVEWQECADCPGNTGEIHQDTQRDITCWERYYLAKAKQKCRVCGCTWDNACPGGCYWVEDDLCSRCARQD